MAVRTVNIGRATNRSTNTPGWSGNFQLAGTTGLSGQPIHLLSVRFRNRRVDMNFTSDLVDPGDVAQTIPRDMGMAFRNADSSKWVGFSVNTMNAAATTDTTDPYVWRNITGALRNAVNAFRQGVADEDFFFDYDLDGLIPEPSQGKAFRFAGKDISRVNFRGRALSAGHIRGQTFYEA